MALYSNLKLYKLEAKVTPGNVSCLSQSHKFYKAAVDTSFLGLVLESWLVLQRISAKEHGESFPSKT